MISKGLLSLCFVMICQILEKLLVAAVADPDAGVRKAVLSSLHGNTSLDSFLAQADSLRAIFISLNDEVASVIKTFFRYLLGFHFFCMWKIPLLVI